MELVTLIAGAATVLSTTQLLPQVQRVYRVGSVAGLSMTWAIAGVALNLGWIAYRWSLELWVGLASPIVASVLYLVLLLTLLKPRAESLSAIGISAIGFAAAIGSAVAGGWIAVGVLLGAGSAVHILPSVWAAFRSPEPHAVSTVMWGIALTQAVLWAVFGWATGDSIHLLYGLATAPGAAVILGRCSYTRRRLAREIEATAPA